MRSLILKSVPVMLALLVAGTYGHVQSKGTGVEAHGTAVLRSEKSDRSPLLAFPDVSPVYIEEPWDTVWCNDTVFVAALICNFGDTIQPFDVEALIDTSGTVIYADTQTVDSLDPDSCIVVYFIDWPVPQVVGVASCVLTVSTLLPADPVPSNDTLRKSVVIWCAAYHDVQVSTIDEPWDTVWCGDTSAVSATVCNYGDTVETFDVEAVIDSGGVVVYADTQSVTALEPDSCLTVDFVGWPVPGGHLVSYTVTIMTLLPGDMNPVNDTLKQTSTNWCPGWRDITLDTITAPPDTVLCDSIVQVSAVVCNLGEFAETFDVEAIITDTSGLPVYVDTAGVADLQADSCVEIVFLSWTVPPVDSVAYNVAITTILPVDAYPQNDSGAKTVYCLCDIVGVSETARPAGNPAFKLGRPLPSPTTGEATISYSVGAPCRVVLRVFDLHGRLVRTLGESYLVPGVSHVTWDGKDSQGENVPSGVYFCDFVATPQEPGSAVFRSTGKLIVLR